MADHEIQTAAVEAVRDGEVELLEHLLSNAPELVSARVDGQRTLLHVATDWPGHFPRNVEIIRALVAHGAEVNAAFAGSHSETPLHWSASADDVAALDALLDGGADIEACGGVISGGTPLADAVAFGQWNAARRLVERGARTTLWQAAALGLMSRVTEFFERDSLPARDEVTNAFWCACHGGQREAAEYLLSQGADLNWVGHNGLTPFDAAARSGADDLAQWLRSRGAKSAQL